MGSDPTDRRVMPRGLIVTQVLDCNPSAACRVANHTPAFAYSSTISACRSERRAEVRGAAEFFTEPTHPAQRRYEAMRAYFVEGASAAQVADRFGYSTASVHQMAT